ncbi:hemicentin-2-like [Ylistrum balloti]|uniref:hemicentin-2-like n=1 Tax=Ylistrum balloti TaxID=509963 RepID=UPI002905E030|nr:hemicentin-2-like [Ylistrum balloti]
MEPTYIGSLILLVCVFGAIQLSEGGPLCGSCTHVSDPRHCDHVTRCGDHEECMTSQYVTLSGHVMYDVGCISSFRCNSFGKRGNVAELDLRERRSNGQTIFCQNCCNTTACNTMSGLCNTKPLDTNGYILCYNCDQMTSPSQCDKITRCPASQQCYIGHKQSGLSGAILWESRCGIGIQECQTGLSAAVAVIGKRISPLCAQCCNSSNFCNDQCSHSATKPSSSSTVTSSTTTSITTTTSSTTTATTSTLSSTSTLKPSRPTITSLSPSQNILPGESVTLHCAATGNPPPHLNWGVTHFVINGKAPNNTRISDDGRSIHIDHFLPDNAGLYICTASNNVGTTSKVTVIHVSKPVIVAATAIHHASIGDNVIIKCGASGEPKPTISWAVLSYTTAADNLSLVGNDLHINGFTYENYGTYKCTAENSQGQAEKLFNISPFRA